MAQNWSKQFQIGNALRTIMELNNFLIGVIPLVCDRDTFRSAPFVQRMTTRMNHPMSNKNKLMHLISSKQIHICIMKL